MDIMLMSDKKLKTLRKEYGLITDYKRLYERSEPKPNQMKVYELLAKKYGYANKESVNFKFQTLKKKYGKELIMPKDVVNFFK